MGAITIIVAFFAAIAAIFAALFFHGRNDARKYETKAESLSKELSDLKCELARREGVYGDAMTPLTKESIMEFLKREKTDKVENPEDSSVVLFELGGAHYQIDYSRLPQQFIIRKGYGGMEKTDIHWDILEQAAMATMKGLVMVKMHVNPDDGYDYLIVSTTHTVAGLREDFDFFMTLISDAERRLSEEYWKIMEVVHPEECVDEQEAAPASMEDMAMKMARIAGEQKKVQS